MIVLWLAVGGAVFLAGFAVGYRLGCSDTEADWGARR